VTSKDGESAFRKYTNKLRSESSHKNQASDQKKYIRSGVKRERKDSGCSLSPNGTSKNIYKRPPSVYEASSIS